MKEDPFKAKRSGLPVLIKMMSETKKEEKDGRNEKHSGDSGKPDRRDK